MVTPEHFGPAEPRLRVVVSAIQRYIKQLRDHSRDEIADQAQLELNDIVAIDGDTLPASTSARLHVVGLYEGSKNRNGSAEVLITDRSGPVTLCVCAYESVNWIIRTADGVNLKRIVVSGYKPQSITSAPQDVSIEGHIREKESDRYRFSAYRNAFSWAEVDRHLKSLTGLPVSTRQGTYRFESEALVVGPENPEWMAMTKLDLLRRLHRAAMIYHAAHFEAEVLAAVFPMIVKSGGSGHETGSSTAIATGSIFGPMFETMQPIHGDIHRLAHDPEFGFFTLHDYKVAKIDPATGVLAETDLPEPERMHGDWPFAVDTQLNRLYMWGNKLYSIDLKTGQLQVHRHGNSNSIVSLTYAPHRKCLYGVGAPYDGSSGGTVTQIHRLNLRGADIAQVTIDTPIPCVGRPEIRMVGERLLLTPRKLRNRQHVSYVIDPDTGRTLFACRQQPRENE